MKNKFIFSILLAVFVITCFVPSIFAKYQYGNILMAKQETIMKKKKVNLVVFPHWIHTMWFKCKTCHDTPYLMQKGVADITMKEIDEGKKCGRCHNGTVAFSQKECKRCHSLSSADAALTLKTDERTARLYPGIFTKRITKGKEKKSKDLKFEDPKNVSLADYKAVADKLGIEWNPEYFTNGMPRDKLKIIDFEKIHLIDKAIIPLGSIDGSKKEEIRENTIIFEVLSDFVDSVGFDHTTHSSLIDCNTCHEKVFISKLGSNEVHMRRNSQGEFCGYCHSKVAFPLAECIRCHKYEKYKDIDIPGEVLRRKNPLKDKKMVVRSGGLVIEGKKSKSQIEHDKRSTEKTQKKIKQNKKKEKTMMPLVLPAKKKSPQPVKTASPVKGAPEKKSSPIAAIKPPTVQKEEKPTTTISAQKKPPAQPVIPSQNEVPIAKPKKTWCFILNWF